MNHRPGAMLSASSQTVLPTVRFSSATTVEFTAAANNKGNHRMSLNECDELRISSGGPWPVRNDCPGRAGTATGIVGGDGSGNATLLPGKRTRESVEVANTHLN